MITNPWVVLIVGGVLGASVAAVFFRLFLNHYRKVVQGILLGVGVAVLVVCIIALIGGTLL